MKITIKRNIDNEYEVPTAFIGRAFSTRPTSIYYTDDKDDAVGTCRYHFGEGVEIRHARGTYDD